MKLRVSHCTTYNFGTPQTYALQQLRLRPEERVGLSILEWNIKIEGGFWQLAFKDEHGNNVDLISIGPGTEKVSVVSEGTVRTTDNNGIIGAHLGMAPIWLYKRVTPLTVSGPQIKKFVKKLKNNRLTEVETLHKLSAVIRETITYEAGRTETCTTSEQVLEIGHGVCQDHTHVFLAATRFMGWPSRYVSGYLLAQKEEQQDATHAWAEVYLTGIGWIGIDVSNSISPDDKYIPISIGLDSLDAAPISGLRFGGGNEAMTVSLNVEQ